MATFVELLKYQKFLKEYNQPMVQDVFYITDVYQSMQIWNISSYFWIML
jgi:hypothetical protein